MPTAIGQPLDRVDGPLKVTGKATYTADQNIPNLAYAVLVTSAIAKGTIASMDTRAAEREPGVLAVLTHKDKPRLAKDPTEVAAGSPADRDCYRRNVGGGVRIRAAGDSPICRTDSVGPHG